MKTDCQKQMYRRGIKAFKLNKSFKRLPVSERRIIVKKWKDFCIETEKDLLYYNLIEA
jgi:hypothetical protein